jgi:hypothetical protein
VQERHYKTNEECKRGTIKQMKRYINKNENKRERERERE